MRALARNRKLSGAAVFGLILGSMLPDVDLLAVVAAFPFNAHLAAEHIHRTCTHSIVVIAAITLLLALFARNARGRALAFGLGAGMLAHVVVDVLIWFSGVDVLWPLGMWGIHSSVNLWVGYNSNPLVGRLLAAVEPGLFGLFLHYLSAMSKHSHTCLECLSALNAFKRGLIAVSCVYVTLAFVLADSAFQLAYYGIYALLVLPVGFHFTVRMRRAIEASVDQVER